MPQLFHLLLIQSLCHPPARRSHGPVTPRHGSDGPTEFSTAAIPLEESAVGRSPCALLLLPRPAAVGPCCTPKMDPKLRQHRPQIARGIFWWQPSTRLFLLWHERNFHDSTTLQAHNAAAGQLHLCSGTLQQHQLQRAHSTLTAATLGEP